MKDAGCDFYVMEVSAHALDLRKLVGMKFDQGIFTNFSQDHLDYFGTMETYRRAKEKFFDPFYIGHAVVNADDEAGKYMLRPTAFPSLRTPTPTRLKSSKAA